MNAANTASGYGTTHFAVVVLVILILMAALVCVNIQRRARLAEVDEGFTTDALNQTGETLDCATLDKAIARSAGHCGLDLPQMNLNKLCVDDVCLTSDNLNNLKQLTHSLDDQRTSLVTGFQLVQQRMKRMKEERKASFEGLNDRVDGMEEDLEALDDTPDAVQAHGGDNTYDQGKYRVHVFTRPGKADFRVTRGGVVDVLVVGGGGGGRHRDGGAGGGGGVLMRRSVKVNARTYDVFVGDGGRGGAGSRRSSDGQTQRSGWEGGRSNFHELIAYGGKPGGVRNTKGGPGAGGSGGANGPNGIWYGSGGNSGGDLNQGTSYREGGQGGEGLGMDVTGETIYYGGGGHTSGSNNGGGGSGGGGGCSTGGDGKPNTGGGGGGGRSPNACAKAGSGGSGVVIVRYLKEQSGIFAMKDKMDVAGYSDVVSMCRFLQKLSGSSFPINTNVDTPLGSGRRSGDRLILPGYDVCVSDGDVTIPPVYNPLRYFTAVRDTHAAFVIVKGDLNVYSGAVFIPPTRKLFMVVYVDGSLRLDGKISMSTKGANHNGTGDSGFSSVFESKDIPITQNVEVPAEGGGGGSGMCRTAGTDGGHGSNGGTGGGAGGGSGGAGSCNYIRGGEGSSGTAFAGGGGGGTRITSTTHAEPNGGIGGRKHPAHPEGVGSMDIGVAGTLIVVVRGDVSGSGSIESVGQPPAGSTPGPGGGGSVTVLHGGNYSSGVTMNARGGSNAGLFRTGAGGNGSARKFKI